MRKSNKPRLERTSLLVLYFIWIVGLFRPSPRRSAANTQPESLSRVTDQHPTECTVLYSGGSDSTLSAALMLERFDRVRLITYRRKHLWFAGNAGRHVPLLTAQYGDDRVAHVYLDCTPEFRRIFYGNLGADLKKYGTHLALLVCLGCKMAMHTRTIIYNLEHGIRYSVVGSRQESSLYPAQMRPVKERIEQMYADYGMENLAPVYEMTDTDRMLYERKLSPQKDLKQQFIFYDTQPSCLYGGVAYVYSRIFYGPLFGNDTRQADSLRYFQDKRPVVDAIVRERLHSGG